MSKREKILVIGTLLLFMGVSGFLGYSLNEANKEIERTRDQYAQMMQHFVMNHNYQLKAMIELFQKKLQECSNKDMKKL